MKKRSSKTSSSYRAPLMHPLAWVCALVLCPLCAWQGVVAARASFLLADHWRVENDRLERKAMGYRLQNQRAEVSMAELKTRAGIEREARKLGWVYPTERRLHIPDR